MSNSKSMAKKNNNSVSKTKIGILDLPNEILWELMLFIPLNDIFKVIVCNKRFNFITLNDNFWKMLYVVNFPYGYPKLIKNKEFSPKHSWSWKKRTKKVVKFKNKIPLLLGDRNFYSGYYDTLPNQLKMNIDLIKDDQLFSLLMNKRKDGNLLKYAQEKKYNRKLVLEAVGFSGHSLKFASKNLQNDKKIVMKAVKNDGLALAFSSDEVKEDREIVLEAVKNNGLALEFGLLYSTDREIVLIAVKNDGLALKFTTLNDDKEIVLEAIKQNCFSFGHACKEFQNDKYFAKIVVKKNGDTLRFCGKDIILDRDIVSLAIGSDGRAIKFSPSFWNDKELALKAVKQNPEAFLCVGDKLKNDKEVALYAIRKKGSFLNECGDSIKNNSDMVMEAICEDPLSIRYASENLRNDEHLACVALLKNGLSLQSVGERIRNNKEFVEIAIKQNIYAFKYAGSALKKDKDLIKLAGWEPL